MTEVMQDLVQEAKKNKFSTIGPTLTDGDVVSIWDNVSAFIEKQMLNQKGVHIPGLGTFSFVQKKLDIGNNKFILIQRPVFILAEKFAQTHGLQYTKHHTSGQLPIVQLNFAALAYESPFDRGMVESCVKECLGALSRSVSSKRNVEFAFAGIGRLQIRENKVKMKFYKDFLNSMDGSGKLVDALQNRPGTVDSVMSDRSPSRPLTGQTIVLPKIGQGSSGLAPTEEKPKSPMKMPTISEEEKGGNIDNILEIADKIMETENEKQPEIDDVSVDYSQMLKDEYEARYGAKDSKDNPFDEVKELNEMDLPGILMQDKEQEAEALQRGSGTPPSRQASRLSMPMAKASGVNFAEELVAPTPHHIRAANAVSKSSPAPLQYSPKPPSPPELNRTKSMDRINFERIPTPPGSSCGHANAGQELCYLCHQRARRNIPVSFAEERKRREEEEDRLLQQFQHMKDTESILREQANNLGKRHNNQKVAAFNLGVSEAVKDKMKYKPKEPPKAYVFHKRPLTPPRFIKQSELFSELEKQVDHKDQTKKKRRADEEFLERLEQVQLAEDLAAQREQYLRSKADQTDQYRKALSAQLKFKPVQIPARQPDSSEPIFGKYDSTNEKLFEKRERAHNLYREQLDIVAQRKRDAILRKLTEQKEEEEVLDRTKRELLEDRANRYHRLSTNRKHLEEEWQHASYAKREREQEEKARALSPGILVHEQCDKYKRCGQCKRRTTNCGESNIWSESRYIPGSRLMV